MSYPYRTSKKRNGINSDEKYYPVPVAQPLVDTRMLIEELSEYCTLTAPDIRATLAGLAEVIGKHVRNGKTVRLDDIGSFWLSITGDGAETEREVQPHTVRANRVCFRADSVLNKKAKKVEFERVQS